MSPLDSRQGKIVISVDIVDAMNPISSIQSSQRNAAVDREMVDAMEPSSPLKSRQGKIAVNKNLLDAMSPASPLESRQGKIAVDRNMVDAMTRQPASPTRSGQESVPREVNLLASCNHASSNVQFATGEQDKRVHVELTPGVTTVLRRAEETLKAVENNFFIPIACLFCTLDLFCIANAQFVVCPKCRVVSPMANGLGPLKGKREGLGLGLTYGNLVAIRAEMSSSVT